MELLTSWLSFRYKKSWGFVLLFFFVLFKKHVIGQREMFLSGKH